MSIQGVVLSGTTPLTSPMVGVIAREKTGKSILSTTLFDWPTPGARPLVVNADETGPDSCAKIGKPVYCLPIHKESGERYWDKMRQVATKLENAFRQPNGAVLTPAIEGHPITSIVIDCASTMADKIYNEAQLYSRNTNPQSHYGVVLDNCRSFMYRVMELGIPVVWLGWLREPETVEKRHVPGGINIIGSFRSLLAGKVQAMVYMEKAVPMPNEPLPISSDGFVRKFWTQSYAGINAESRYALPNPMPANLAWLVHYIKHGYQPQAEQRSA